MQLLMTVTITNSRLLYEYRYTTVDKREAADVLRLLVVCTLNSYCLLLHQLRTICK